jgi:DNA-binding response OmpR family regulator
VTPPRYGDGVPAALDPDPRVLLVEDDDTIGRNLVSGLQAHGYSTTWFRTGEAALAEARREGFDVVLLDLGLPDVDGTDVARDLRQHHPDLLIIMLTARGDDIDVVVGLDLGADDYLIKPVGLSVLLARLRAHLRRRDPAEVGTGPGGQVFTVGDLTVDTGARRCHLVGVEVHLRRKEFDLLAHLASLPSVAVRREDLMAGVWDENWFGSTKTLDVTMASLRRRLDHAAMTTGTAPGRLPVITTLRGHGYRLELPN